MGAINPLASKVSEYQHTNAFQMLYALMRALEERRRLAEELNRYREPGMGINSLENLNKTIMDILHIPLPDQQESMPNSMRSMGQYTTQLKEQSSLRQNRIETLEKSLQLILDFITEATGRNVDQSMVKELCSNINRTAREALKK